MAQCTKGEGETQLDMRVPKTLGEGKSYVTICPARRRSEPFLKIKKQDWGGEGGGMAAEYFIHLKPLKCPERREGDER